MALTCEQGEVSQQIINVDGERVQQILRNLMAHVFNESRAGNQIHLASWIKTKDEESRLHFMVSLTEGTALERQNSLLISSKSSDAPGIH